MVPGGLVGVLNDFDTLGLLRGGAGPEPWGLGARRGLMAGPFGVPCDARHEAVRRNSLRFAGGKTQLKQPPQVRGGSGLRPHGPMTALLGCANKPHRAPKPHGPDPARCAPVAR